MTVTNRLVLTGGLGIPELGPLESTSSEVPDDSDSLQQTESRQHKRHGAEIVGTAAGAASMRGRGAATNLRLKTMEKQALNGPPLVTFERVPALDVNKLLRHVPRPPTLTYVLLTYVLEMPHKR